MQMDGEESKEADLENKSDWKHEEVRIFICQVIYSILVRLHDILRNDEDQNK
jgi:hypothetical protein